MYDFTISPGVDRMSVKRTDIGAGDLVQSVAFDAPNPQPDGYGGVIHGFTDPLAAYQCRAKFVYLRGGEAVLASRLTGKQPVIVTIRTSAAARLITPEWRMRDVRTGVEYNIRSVEPTEDRAWLQMLCESGVAV